MRSRQNQMGLMMILAVIFTFIVALPVFAQVTVNYLYDDMNRLVKVEYGVGTLAQYRSYVYDEVGNRTAQLPFSRKHLVDFDGDVKVDLAIYRISTGAWYVSPSGGGGSLWIWVGWGFYGQTSPWRL